MTGDNLFHWAYNISELILNTALNTSLKFIKSGINDSIVKENPRSIHF